MQSLSVGRAPARRAAGIQSMVSLTAIETSSIRINMRTGRNLQTSRQLQPIDLARAHGLSTQAVRNYEAAGILPGAERTPRGYRTYTPRHAQALRAFLAL